MPQVNTQDFFPASVLSMQNPQLQEALRRAGTGFDGARLEAINEVGQGRWEEWREEARQIKVHTLEHLDYYLELLTERSSGPAGRSTSPRMRRRPTPSWRSWPPAGESGSP